MRELLAVDERAEMIRYGSRSTHFLKDQCWRRVAQARPQGYAAASAPISAGRAQSTVGASR
jgi:hypothetical protein